MNPYQPPSTVNSILSSLFCLYTFTRWDYHSYFTDFWTVIYIHGNAQMLATDKWIDPICTTPYHSLCNVSIYPESSLANDILISGHFYPRIFSYSLKSTVTPFNRQHILTAFPEHHLTPILTSPSISSSQPLLIKDTRHTKISILLVPLFGD